ncbi:MAG: ATP-dependent DNA helicase RecG [Bacteriovoracaceae bacterium]
MSTKLKTSSTSKLSLNSPIDLLIKSKSPSINTKKLIEAGARTIQELIQIFPLRIIKIPEMEDFSHASIGSLFHGQGRVASMNARPAFWAKGKGRAMLYNITLVVKDPITGQMIYLSWFNCYGSTKIKLEAIKEIEFFGEVSEYKSIRQITNPDYVNAGVGEVLSFKDLKIQYPTVSGVPGTFIQKLIEKIPAPLWDEIEETLPKVIIEKRHLNDLKSTLKIIHGKTPNWKESDYRKAYDRLVYEEFFQEQIKVHARRSMVKKTIAPLFPLKPSHENIFLKLFPYSLTPDQIQAVEDIKNDLISGEPMMRLIQGDVGSGKTSIALMAALTVMDNGAQVALMCPTETLATQHFETLSKLTAKTTFNIGLLLGGQTAKEKKVVLSALRSGELNMCIGTHSLFQDSVEFKNLGLAIIDEQHKFGVEQRIKLTQKGNGTHSLIMTATPIPRSLSLTQYGDLDFSIVKTMPGGRKGIRTRIVEEVNFEKFLGFVQTRLELKEQAYVVVPAIEESETMEMQNLEQVLQDFKGYFPKVQIGFLHGKMKSDEKLAALENFVHGITQILISTSVIEVGINVINATVMAIMSPDRFGLSSLHQLRGRVGRGDKAGFCFLVLDQKKNREVMERLKVIEGTTDGFQIAEADLTYRGEGDLFGTNQSGISTKRFANLFTHQHVLMQVIDDTKTLIESKQPEIIKSINNLLSDPKVLTTI